MNWVVYCNGQKIRENDLPYAVGALIYPHGLSGPCYRVIDVDENSRVCLPEKVMA